MAYLRTREACTVLNISRWTLAKLIKNGEITAIKGSAPNSHIKVDEDSMRKYIERNKVKADA